MQQANANERRRQARMKLEGYSADIADGPLVFVGTIQDISLEGFCLNDLPDRFAIKGKNYRVIISGGPNSTPYKMTVFPKWGRINQLSMDVGFKITEAPARWEEFIREQQRKNL